METCDLRVSLNLLFLVLLYFLTFAWDDKHRTFFFYNDFGSLSTRINLPTTTICVYYTSTTVCSRPD